MPELSFATQLALGLLTVGFLGWMLTTRRRRWVPVGQLKSMYIYPLKSGKAREISEAECTPLGLKWSGKDRKVPLRDRVFVVYDEEKKEFLTGKSNKNMIFIKIEPITTSSVVFSYPGKEDIELDLTKFKHFDETCITMWVSEKIRSVDCGNEIAKWMSEVVRGESNGLRVGYWPETEEWRRDIETIRAHEIAVFNKMNNKFTGAYSDLSSYFLVSQSSIEDLNSKLEECDKVSALNFRPNLLIEGADPYAEDKWDCIKIGEVVFQNFKLCTRCLFTNMDPETGEKNKANEPIRTLRTYRSLYSLIGEEKIDRYSPAMGVYVGLIQPGTIKTGDTVYILK